MICLCVQCATSNCILCDSLCTTNLCMYLKNLLEKIAQLEDLCAKKEKFIQSNKMIVKFREDHIVRLERLHREAGGSLLPPEQEGLLRELREELQMLREQVSLWAFPSGTSLSVGIAHVVQLCDGWLQVT